jgi:hypothetical protein
MLSLRHRFIAAAGQAVIWFGMILGGLPLGRPSDILAVKIIFR